MGEFGDKFRNAREKKELSLDDVSNVTKIGSRMLQAIEDEHFDQLPGGVFNKGFIRAYAKHLGLNSEDAITDYLACLRQAQIDAHEVWEPERPRNGKQSPRPAPPEKRPLVTPNVAAPPQATERRATQDITQVREIEREHQAPPVEGLPELQLPRAEDVRPGEDYLAEDSPREIPWRIVAVAALVLILGILFWTLRSHNSAANASGSAQAKDAPLLAPVPASQTQQTKAEVSNSAMTPAHPASQPPTRPTAAPAKPPAAAATSSSATTAAATVTPSDKDKNNDKNDVTVRTLPKSTAKASQAAAQTLKLVIRATETSSISVFADGQPVSHETLIAPAHTSVRASREITVRIGNAAGVTFLWNGQEIPADGAESEAKTFVFDSNGMRVIPTPPRP